MQNHDGFIGYAENGENGAISAPISGGRAREVEFARLATLCPGKPQWARMDHTNFEPVNTPNANVNSDT